MKISTKGRYALRLMLDLACNDDGKPIPIKSIANRQDISDKYLEQIISGLSRAGFVKSSRGAQGGYRLAKDPKELTVGAILRQIEGSLVSVACLEDTPSRCPHADTCATLDVWQEIDDAVSLIIDRITLADLVVKHHKKKVERAVAIEGA